MEQASSPFDIAALDVPDVELTPRIITCTVEGIVEEEDLAMLVGGKTAAPGESNAIAPRTLKHSLADENPANLPRIRERHHSVARLIASGMMQTMVAKLSGYTDSYLSILLNNPAMQSLVDMYRMQHGKTAEVIGEKLRTVGLKAMEQLEDRLDDGELNNEQLLATAKLGLDRSGYGPASSQKVETTTHLVDHARIAELSLAARQGSRAFIIPVSDVRKQLGAPAGDPA